MGSDIRAQGRLGRLTGMWNRVLKQGRRLAGMLVAAGALGVWLATTARWWQEIHAAGRASIRHPLWTTSAEVRLTSGLLFLAVSPLLIRSIVGSHCQEVGKQRRSLHIFERCAYNLLGNESGVCPECGERHGAALGLTAARGPQEDFAGAG
ncbi:MAG: hypothetical protein IT449_18010 [Phycisphaerales bacterium]|nr:hypothetical protein [Phycisphaerales bacterium]